MTDTNELECSSPREVAELVTHLLKEQVVLCIWGPPGCGKSDIVAQAVARLGWDMIVMHPVVCDPTDFKGLPAFKDGGAEFVPFADLQRMMMADKPLVVFLDDLGQAVPSVQAAVMQLVLARQIGGKKISDQVRFVAASNRAEDKAGVSRMLTPLLNRVEHVDIGVSVEDWQLWAVANNIDARVRAFIAWKNDQLHVWDAQTAQVTVYADTPDYVFYTTSIRLIGGGT